MIDSTSPTPRPNPLAIFLLVCLFVLLAIAARADNVPPVPRSGIVDDGAPGWIYTQTKIVDDPPLHNGSAHALPPGASATIAFAGAGIQVFTMAGPVVIVDGRAHKLGQLECQVDGKTIATKSQILPDATYNYMTFQTSQLDSDTLVLHVLTLTATAGWAVVDYINVLPAAPNPASAPAQDAHASGVARIDYANGFYSLAGLRLNGVAELYNGCVVLTTGNIGDTGSVFTRETVSARKFDVRFRFQLKNCRADGMTFCLQSTGPGAIGGGGEGMGYAGIPRSIAVKFDPYDNEGEGSDSTGLYIDGAMPSVPAVDLTATGLQIAGGNPIDVSVDYEAGALRVGERDTVTGATASQLYQIDVPGYVGDLAYMGFTGASGSNTEVAAVLSWSAK